MTTYQQIFSLALNKTFTHILCVKLFPKLRIHLYNKQPTRWLLSLFISGRAMMGVLTQHLTNTELFTAAIFTIHSACGPPGLENSGTSCRKRTRADVSTSVPSCHKPGGVSPCMKRNVMSTLHSHSIAGRGHAAEYSPRTNRGYMSHQKRNLEPILGRATQHLQPQAGLH